MSRFHFPAALALACSLLLAACSSGDSGPPQAQLDAEAARDAALAAQMDAEAARDAALAAQMKAEADEAAAVAAAQAAVADAAEARAEAAQAAADLAAAQASQADAEAARDAAVAAQMEAEAARDAAVTAQMEAEAARDAALAAQMQAEASRDAAIAQRNAVQAQLDAIQDQQNLEDTQAAVATARLIFAALTATTGDQATFNPNPTFTAAHNMPSSLAGVTTDPTPASTILTTTMGTRVSALGSWSGTEFSRKVGALTDTIRVYSNIGPGTRGSFATWASTSGNLATAATPDGAGLVSSVAVVAADAQYVAGSAFSSDSGTVTHARNRDNNMDTTDGLELFETRGTLNGAPGLYRCSGTDPCTSAVADDGGVTLGGTTWLFIPDPNAMVLNPDGNYQYFGWWLRDTGAADATRYAVDVFTGQVGSAAVDTSALRGSATYSGYAVGKYALYPGPQAGHFTANVRLAATFAAATTISGTIDGFSGGDGMSNWAVDLPELTLAAGANVDTATDMDEMPTWAVGDADYGASGTWGVTLVDAVGAGMPRAGTPQAAIGEFTTRHGVLGAMEGAFGAGLQ